MNVRPSVALIAALLLVLIGAAASYLLLRTGSGSGDAMGSTPSKPEGIGSHSGGHTTATAPGATTGAGDASVRPGDPLPDVVVPLSAEGADRAGIVVTPVTTGSTSVSVRLPGIVEPNAYRQVTVTPLVAGRVTRVTAQLGEHVRRGQAMAYVYSPELAEAQTQYVSARALLEAHDRELRRTQKLVEIGAASRQELERVHAEHQAQTAEVESARSQLQLLGMPQSAIQATGAGKEVSATTTVPAPLDGVVTERLANPGLNVDPAAKLFTVVDLSTVWVVADLYEKDFSRVRVGSVATITTTAYPDLAVKGQVNYIDPQVSPDTRTAKVRVEVPNPGSQLRLGMFTDVSITGAGEDAATLTIPRTAVQTVGDRQVVYLVNPKERGRFVEREVRLGQLSGEQVEALTGVAAGDVVVTEGSFFVRAERERLGLRPASVDSGAAAAKAATPDATSVQTAKILITEQGFNPAKVTLRAGKAARLTFVRTTEKTCATEIAFPSLNTKKPLPLNQPVEIDLTPAKHGEIAFTCGMNMLSGTVVAQ